MTTQPNEHQKVLRDFVFNSIGAFGDIKNGNVNLTNLVELSKSIDYGKVITALQWLQEAEFFLDEKLPPDAKIPTPAEMRAILNGE